MFSLQRLVGGDGEFFDLLESSADQCFRGAKAVQAMLQKPMDERSLDSLIQIRQKSKSQTEHLFELLCHSFVTPLDREDIERLATALYKIPKTLEKFAQHLAVCHSRLGPVDFSRQITILAEVTEVVFEMVKDVRHSPEVPTVKQQRDRIQQLEGDADKLLLELTKDLHRGRYGAIETLALGYLYDLLEKAVDRCRDAGNILFGMALKLS